MVPSPSTEVWELYDEGVVCAGTGLPWDTVDPSARSVAAEVCEGTIEGVDSELLFQVVGPSVVTQMGALCAETAVCGAPVLLGKPADASCQTVDGEVSSTVTVVCVQLQLLGALDASRSAVL